MPRKNILLLSMSVTREIDKAGFYYYQNEGKKYYFAGVSSLEPGTKRVIMELAEKKEILDEIYILCSAESKDDSKFFHKYNGERCNSVDYYKKRIESFLRGNIDGELATIGQDIPVYEKKILDSMIDVELKSVLVKDAKSKETIESDLQEIINKIWKQFDDDKKARESLQDKIIGELNTDEAEKNLLISFLKEDSHEVKIEHYSRLVQKYQEALEDDTSDDIMSKLRYRNFMFARLRLKYENELYKDNQAQKLVRTLYEEIERMHNEIEKLRPDYKNKIKLYIKYCLVRKIGQKNFVEAFPQDVKSQKLAQKYAELLDAKQLFVEIDALGIESGISDAIQEIQKQMKENDINIYVDTQGGKRIQANTLNGTLEMLKTTKICKVEIKQLLSIDFNYNNAVNEIQDVTETNNIFQRVSDFHEFLNFGKATSMAKFYAGKPESQIVNVMKDVSDALLICNMIKFEEKIVELRDCLREYESVQKKDALFSLFLEDIKEHYKIISKENHTLVDELIWCMNKELYQQALALIEAKSPEFFVKYKILYYAKNVKERDGVEALFKWIFNKAPYKDGIRRKMLYKFEDINHYFIKDFLVYDYSNNIVMNSPTKNLYRDFVNSKYNIQNTKNINDALYFLDFFKSQAKDTYSVTLYSDSISSLDNILKYYFYLSDIRNGSMHAKFEETDDDLDTLKKLINSYINLLKNSLLPYRKNEGVDNFGERMIETDIVNTWLEEDDDDGK